MRKKDRLNELFGLKVLAIIGSAVFMVSGVNDLYMGISDDAEMKKEVLMVEGNNTAMAELEEIATVERAVKDIEEKRSAIMEYGISEDDYMLAKIAMAEAESEDMEGKALVILVVLNRVRSAGFPDSVSEVIFQRNQFSPVSNGRYDKIEPDQECYEALDLVQLENWDESHGALYFESGQSSDWHKNNLHFLFQHGNHYFYTDKELAE